MRDRFRHRLAPVAVFIVIAGCSETKTTEPGDGFHGLAPDFSLTDVNPTSASHDQSVSPRSHLEKISAWYFGHAT